MDKSTEKKLRDLGSKLKKFFINNKHKITEGEVEICMGNEACDLDSFISSLAVAYAEDVIHVVPMRRDVFKTKGELLYVCNKFGIALDDLIYIEKPRGQFSDAAQKIGTYFLVGSDVVPLYEKSIKLILTDHNVPMSEFSDCEITMVIDHHALSNSISTAKRIYIDIDVGSATTLVSKYLGDDLTKKIHCFNKKVHVPKNEVRKLMCAQLASLLLIPIIIDTHFLRSRTSIFDYKEYRKLKKMSGLRKKELKAEYKAIRKARKNDKHFDTDLILQKDFKRFNAGGYTFGSSTVKYKLEKWIDRESQRIKGIEKSKEGMALFLELETFRSDMGLDFFYVGTKIKGSRNIIIINFPYLKELVENEGMKRVEYKGLSYYKVRNELSRKVLVPKMIEIINQHDVSIKK